MVRILIFGMNDNPGGVESFLLNYVSHFDLRKVQVDFLCNTEVVAYEKEIRELGCGVYRISARSHGFFRYHKELKAFFESHKDKYDCIWVNLCSLANIDYLKMAYKYGIPVRILHSHNSRNMDSGLRGLLHEKNKKNVEKYATEYWACSEDAGKWFYPEKLYHSPKFRIIRNAISTDSFRFSKEDRDRLRKEMRLENAIVVGHVGRLHFQKNQMFLLEVFERFHKTNDNAVLLLVGQGEDEEKLRRKVQESGLEDSVRFLGVRHDVPALLSAMDVFVFPSLFEGLSLVAMEVQAAGLWMIASDKVVPEYAVVSDRVCLLSLEEDKENWSLAMEKAIHKKADRFNYADLVKSAGFDICKEAETVQNLFLTYSGKDVR